LLAIAGLLAASQLIVHAALARREDDAGVVNLAGRQRMLGERLVMLVFAMREPAGDPAALRRDLATVADQWERNQAALRADRAPDDELAARFAAIAPAQRALLGTARTAIAGELLDDAALRAALADQDTFLAGMDDIVGGYADEAHARVVELGHLELVLFAAALVLLAFEGAFVLRPAVRALGVYLAERERVEHELVQVTDREQQRLARELHDGIGQHLVGIGYLVKAVPRTSATAELDEIAKLVADAVEQTRALARGLYSHALDRDDLGAALGELAGHVTRVFAVPCRAELDDVPELASEACTQLYRIAREAAVNAARHAGAASIVIALTARPGALVLAVRDDGAGIRDAASSGMGLNVMAYRAKMIGAALVIDSGAHGTSVTCTLPTPA
jgi:signal transduction histidine kinase